MESYRAYHFDLETRWSLCAQRRGKVSRTVGETEPLAALMELLVADHYL